MFHRAAENDGDVYTAGRVFLDTNAPGGPGQNIEVDAGSVTSNGYNLAYHFDFNFVEGARNRNRSLPPSPLLIAVAEPLRQMPRVSADPAVNRLGS